MDLQREVIGLNTRVPTLGGERVYVNLDNAASTPPFRSVMEAINNFAPWYSSVHRGSGYKSRLSTAAYEHAREVVGTFVGAGPKTHAVIFGKNTTEAINQLAHRLNLRRKDVVLISHLEHHSNDLPWRACATVKRIRLTPQGAIDKDDFKSLLARYGKRIRLVAISGASNVTGHLPDVHWFARRTHAAGAQIFVDCAQLAAHRKINMRSLDDPEHLDYIALSAHKMYAPFGTGALIGRKDIFTQGTPVYSGGGTISVVTPQTVDWAEPPDSDEAGSPNVIGAITLARAIQTLERIGLGTIAAHEAKITAYALKKLGQIPGVMLYGDIGPKAAENRSGVIPFSVKNMPPHLVAAILGFEWGIGVRNGCFCAQPYVMQLLKLTTRQVQISRTRILQNVRDQIPGLVRVSFGLYNTTDDVDILVKALTAIANKQYGKYRLDITSGNYTPLGYKEDFSRFF